MTESKSLVKTRFYVYINSNLEYDVCITHSNLIMNKVENVLASHFATYLFMCLPSPIQVTSSARGPL